MIPIGNRQKPLLEYILVHLRKHGIVDVKLLVGYKHEQIVNYFNEGSRLGIKIEYFVDDPSFGGSGGALLNAAARDAFSDADVLLLYYGDILSNIDLSEMVGQHVESGSIATLAVSNGFEVPIGVAEVEGKNIKGWVEKPTINVFAGIGVVALSPVALRGLKELSINRKNINIMGDLIPLLLKHGERVEAYMTDSFWYDLGSTEKYEKIDNGIVDKLFHP
jgi:mannose-1-phosphate guanylyltransferase